jgi:RimJ/RimL family protein N-acetyltransferase
VTWPLHDLVLRTPALELRGLTEDLALALAAVVPEDLEHDPRLTHVSPGADVLQAYWRNSGLWSPDDWVCAFAVLLDGDPIGLQALEAKDLAQRHVVDTHSWLVAGLRGHGYGKQMRAAVLELAFRHLGAQSAVTEAWADNAASLGVSRSLGYRDNGVDVHAGPRVMQRLLLAGADWRSPWPIQVENVEPCLPLFGLR